MNAKKAILQTAPFLLCAAIVCGALLYPERKKGAAAEKRVVRVWNVDTFEGGKGSRTSFLKNAARETEKRREGVYYLVTSYSPEGAEEAFRQGGAPDVLSFGVGFSSHAEQALALSYSFPGGEAGGKCYAFPWCRGAYYLFSLTENFEEEGSAAISVGGDNLPQAAAYFGGITGEELPSLTAYSEFLRGGYRYLLGTQRDVCRFAVRGATVYSKPITEYNDLYQYYSILSERYWEDCMALLDTLLSQKQQDKLSEIGMDSVINAGASEAKFTVSAFSSKEALAEIVQAARNRKNPEKYLKVIENKRQIW